MSTKRQLGQLSLLEKRLRFDDLPQKTRQRLVQRLARLLLERLASSAQTHAKEQPHE